MNNNVSSTTYTSASVTQGQTGIAPQTHTIETLTNQHPGSQPVTLVSEHGHAPTGNFNQAVPQVGQGTFGHAGLAGQPGLIGQTGFAGQPGIGQTGFVGQPGIGQTGYVGPQIGQGTFGHTGLTGQPGMIGQAGYAGTTGSIGQTGYVDQPPVKQGFFSKDSLVHDHYNVATVTFRPLEARFNKDKDLIGKMDPYCKIKIGWHSTKSLVAKSEGTHPTWNDVLVLNRKHGEHFAKLKCKDRDRITLNDNLGSVKINLDEIASKGRVNQWYTLTKRDKVTGEILLDIEYHANPTAI